MLHDRDGIREYMVEDDIFNLDIVRSKKICDLIIESGMRIHVQFGNGLRAERFDEELVKKLVVILRLAVIFHRSRSDIELPHISVELKDEKLTLNIPSSWTEQHPLTLNDLEQEADYLQALGVKLRVRTIENQTGNTKKIEA